MIRLVLSAMLILSMLSAAACSKSVETSKGESQTVASPVSDETTIYTGYVTKMTTDRILVASEMNSSSNGRTDALWIGALGKSFSIGQRVRATLFGEIDASYPGIGGANRIDAFLIPVSNETKLSTEQALAKAINFHPEMEVPIVTNVSYDVNTHQWSIGLLDGLATSEHQNIVYIYLNDADGSIGTPIPTTPAYDASDLVLTAPQGWSLLASEHGHASIHDVSGANLGEITTYAYAVDFDFKFYKPNHSEVTSEEVINIPLGSVKLYTLDADNGTAASGIEGTHDVYYAVVPIQDKAIFLLEFSRQDKEASTKKQFLELLNGLQLNTN